MSGTLQAVFQNQRSFVLPLVIGDAYEGGFFAGQISTSGNSVATHNLVVGPVSTAQSQNAWKTTDSDTTGTSSPIDGPTNSANMNDANHPAAQFCEGLTIGGKSDWYMPAKNELDVCYFNLKPTTDTNNTNSGINVNSVPARASNNTSGTPAQTSASAFQFGGAQAYTSNFYWASTQQSSAYGVCQTFTTGYQYRFMSKSNANLRVRAIRRVAV